MTPPETGGKGSNAGTAATPAASALVTLQLRADFLRTASAKRQGTQGFLLQARRRDETGVIRVGYTCSKKVGNAVMRNRAKRRLRAIARAVIARDGRPGWDYVLVGRPGATAERAFASLITDLERALRQIHGATA